MSTTVARIKKDGTLLLKDTIDERLPAVLDGLVAHYPFDGTTMSNGLWDNFSYSTTGMITTQDIYATWLNLPQGTIIKFRGEFKKSVDMVNLVGFFNWFQLGTVWQWNTTYFNTEIGTEWTYIEKTYTVGATAGTITGGVQGITVRNGTAAGTIEWRNCEMMILPLVDTNTIITEDGVAIQETTTSLINYGTEFNNWGFASNSGSYPTVTPNCTFSPKSTFDADKIYIPNDGTYPRIYQYFTPASTTVHTFSIWLKSSGGNCTTRIVIFRQAPWTDEGTLICTITNVWKKFTLSFTPLDTTQHQVYIGSHDSEKGYTYFAWGAQLEARSFDTAFVNGIHFATTLSLSPTTLDTESFTVFMRLSLYSSTGQNMYFDAYPKLYMFRDNSGHYCSFSDGAQRTVNFGTTPAKEEFTVAVTRQYDSSTSITTKTYYNGNFGASFTSTTPPSMLMNNASPSGIKLKGWGEFAYPANSNVKELTTYNRALSASEIKALSNEGFKTTIVKTTTPLLVESPSIPIDAYYFPLSTDTKDITKAIDASNNTNVVFEDGAAWVGTAVSNLIVNTNLNTWSKDGSGQGTLGVTTQFESTGIFIKDVSSNTRLSNINQAITLNSSYNISASILRYSNAPTFRWQISPRNAVNTQVGSAIWTESLGNFTKNIGGWQHVNHTFMFSDPSILTIFPWFQDGADYVQYTHEFYLKNPMLVNKSFYSPFTTGTRGASALEYNLREKLGLDWNGDWTICYWKKPVSTINDTSTNYNVDSLGTGGNTVGAGYAGLGKETNSNTIISWVMPLFAGTTFLANLPTNYFNTWSFIIMKKTGVNISLTHYGLGTSTYNVGTITSNYFSTQYGYDFKLGGFTNGNPPNSYYRDLVVVKRALSDAEIQNVYKQFSIYKTKVNTYNIIEEGI